MNSKRIAIVGAGIGGIALAILAARKGYQVSIFERDSEISSIGAGVTLWPNAMFVLQQMGLDKHIQALGGMPLFMRLCDQHGTVQSEFDIAKVNTLSGFSSISILRRDLMSVLGRTLADLGANIHFNSAITVSEIAQLKQDFDLVVGADGRMNSVVRQFLYAEKITPQYQGFINIIAISQLKPGTLDNVIHDFRGRGERFGIVPVKADLCYWAAGWSANIDKARPLSAWYEEMHQRFLTWPDAVQQVLKSYDENSLKRIFVHDIDRLPYWHQGNVLIMGDAAHAPLPTSGQGACQALEDAWHLVRVLEKYDDLEHALTAFYQQRIDKTSASQLVGRQVAQKIFTTAADTNETTALGISAQQLVTLWMQGLSN
ncbi:MULTISPECIES: FAD-dependent monooxygenase [Pseudoalteromonas]|uniref:FAD-dependent monooxygenase n=1 Tax=Pseudoalteromonas TaxID=53246 RepID=UPI001601BC9E|nr:MULTISPECIES: FAD-dependent monooxygenase [Pseudoalteromonas]MBB1410815.1 FAD-dependent monooxygenase [Pseudoalteromonas sp. SG44-17]